MAQEPVASQTDWLAAFRNRADNIRCEESEVGHLLNTTLLQVLEALGAAPLEVPFGDIAPAILTGAFGATLASYTPGTQAFGFHQTAGFTVARPYRSDIRAVAIAVDTWQTLDPVAQSALAESAAVVADAWDNVVQESGR